MRHRGRPPSILVFTMAVVLFAPASRSADEPIWILKFEHDKPQRIAIGDGQDADVYWYFTYRMTNEDSEPHKFFLDISAESDKGYTYHDDYEPVAYQAVRKRLGITEEKILWSQADVTYSGTATNTDELFPRTLNLPVIPAKTTVECVAVFQGWDPEMDQLTIRLLGLTNDVIMEKTGVPNERKISERVLLLRYERPGDEFYTTLDSLTFAGKEWVTETRTIKTDLR